MNPIRHIRRFAAVLAGLAAPAVLAAAPALRPDHARPRRRIRAPARRPGPDRPHHRGGGMPGWQIALIAVGAALLAATVAVLADRARAARRPAIPTAA